jgi:predicted HTH transcriptional regulator
MLQLGVNLRKEGKVWIATCKRLNVVAESTMETEALHKARDAMIVCLRAALRDLENRTSAELETALEDGNVYEDEVPDDEKPDTRDIRAVVLDYFKAHEKATSRSVARDCGIPVEQATNYICNLFNRKKLKRVSKGVYAIAEHEG